MEKKRRIILLILILLLLFGIILFLSNNFTVQNIENANNTTHLKNNTHINESNITTLNTSNGQISSIVKAVSKLTNLNYNAINDNSQNAKDDSLTLINRYIQCICGRFIPLGETTKKLPDNAICTSNNNVNSSYYVNEGYEYTVSYDEASNIWNEHGADILRLLELDEENNVDIHTDEIPPYQLENNPNSPGNTT